MAEVEPLIARTRLTVSSHVSPSWGRVRSDRQKVKQIVLNLLSNALEVHARRARCTIRVDHGGGQKTVADRGGRHRHRHRRRRTRRDLRGLPQADSSSPRPYGGTGLGLVDLPPAGDDARRRIDLDSELGRGSDVHPGRVHLIAQMTEAKSPISRMTPPARAGRRRLSGRPRDVRRVPGVLGLPRRRGGERQEALDKAFELLARPHPDGPLAAGDGRLGGHPPPQAGRARPSTSRHRAHRPRAGRRPSRPWTPAATRSSPSRACPTTSWRSPAAARRRSEKKVSRREDVACEALWRIQEGRARASLPGRKPPPARGHSVPAGQPPRRSGAHRARRGEDSRRRRGKVRLLHHPVDTSRCASGRARSATKPADVHTVNYKDIAAVVSDVPLGVLDSTRENVLAHERVNEIVMRDHTVIPMSFGTVFKTREDIVELLRSAYDAFGDVLVEDAGQAGVRPQGAVGPRRRHPRDRGRGRGHPPAQERDRVAEGLDLLRAHAVRPR